MTKCEMHPLNLLTPVPENPTVEELVTWLASCTNNQFAQSLVRFYGEKKFLPPKQEKAGRDIFDNFAIGQKCVLQQVWEHDWREVSTKTDYFTQELNTGRWIDHQKCRHCGEERELVVNKNYSGD